MNGSIHHPLIDSRRSRVRTRAAIIVVSALIAAAVVAIWPGRDGEPIAPASAATASSRSRIIAVGDVACPPNESITATRCRHAKVAKIAESLAPARVLLLGDIQYLEGALSDFRQVFAKDWKALRGRAWPTPGNHEYGTTGASGYFDYFGADAGRRGRGYQSFNLLRRWHIIALNSNCEYVSCATGSAQWRWLRRDLAQARRDGRRCVAAYWHHPLFSSGQHGANPAVKPLWAALRRAGADLVLSGHDHSYERFASQDENGRRVARKKGMRQFVVGTGGFSHYAFGPASANSQRRVADAFGVLSLDLRGGSYSWRFVDEDGRRRDGGSERCD